MSTNVDGRSVNTEDSNDETSSSRVGEPTVTTETSDSDYFTTKALKRKPKKHATMSPDSKHTQLDRKSLAPDLIPMHEQYKPLRWEEADKLLEEHGRNVVREQQILPWYKILGRCLLHPFNFVLIGLAIVSAATQDYRTMTVMLLMVLLSVLVRFVQEIKSDRAAHNLKAVVQNKVTVVRYPKKAESNASKEETSSRSRSSDIESVPAWTDLPLKQDIPLEDVVPGEIVFLSAGDMIPGDVTIYESKDLFVSQAALTGEALPVEKAPAKAGPAVPNQAKEFSSDDDVEPEDEQKVKQVKKEKGHVEVDLERSDMCYMGTSVVSGKGYGVVLSTGSNTVFGQMAKKIAKQRPVNAFEKGVRRISYMFIGIMGVMLPVVLVISGLIQHDWFQAFLFTIAVAVGLTPEMLPMIVNGNLARGAMALSKKQVIVKHLDSIINLGSMSVLCTDKTGTLTQNKVALIKHVDAFGEIATLPLTMAYLNSFFQTGLKNLLDIAVIEYHENNWDDEEELNIAVNYSKVDELPFDFVRRRMSVIIKNPSHKQALLISKGAITELLDTCSQVQIGTRKPQKLTDKIRNRILELAEELNIDGLRAVGVAYKYLEKTPKIISVKHEKELIFVGCVAFLDPPKDSASDAIAMLMNRGVEIKVLTGDSPLVCKKVCEQLKLPIKSIVTTSDIQGLSDDELADVANQGTIFARLTPFQKSQVVNALRRKHVVGFMGDGINDAIALHDADVGISVNEAVDVAKETADIILLEKSLTVLADGVHLGRVTYGNTVKYIKMAVSSNFGNVFSVIIASAWLPFLPMKPIHIVMQNLLYDFSQLAIPWDKMDPEFTQVPQIWRPLSVLRFMACIGPLSSIFDVTTFLFMWFYFDIRTPQDNVTMFQTAWFVEGLLTQTMIIHLIRTQHIPFVQSRAAWPVLAATSIVVAVALALPFIPELNAYLNMVPLPGIFFAYLVGAILGYCIITSIGKTIYIKVFGDWI